MREREREREKEREILLTTWLYNSMFSIPHQDFCSCTFTCVMRVQIMSFVFHSFKREIVIVFKELCTFSGFLFIFYYDLFQMLILALFILTCCILTLYFSTAWFWCFDDVFLPPGFCRSCGSVSATLHKFVCLFARLCSWLFSAFLGEFFFSSECYCGLTCF